MEFDAGAIVFNIKAAGAQVFRQELTQADKAVKDLGTSQKEAAKQTGELGAKQDKTAESSKRLAREQADAAKKAAEYSAAQATVGRTLVTAGAAIVAVTALTVKSAIQWESAWAGVTKTVDGTAEELAGVQSGLRDLTGVLPASHQEIAAVAEAAGQLGVQTKNVVAFTRTMIDLGETTNLSANDAATALARFMNVMGTAQDKTSNLGSSVVALGNNYATTEAEIVNMATRLSGAARQVGLTEGETMGLAAALSSVGIEAEAGGSAVSKVMIDIAASVDKGGERVEQFAKIAGMSADDFTKKWKTDPGAALAAFVKGLADAEKQGGSTLGMLESLGITETRMRDALLRSAAASDQFTEAMGLGNKAFKENNALQDEAAKRYETVESKLAIMNNRINDAAIDLGSVFLPAVAEAAGGIANLADGVASLPEPVKAILGTGGLMVGLIALIGGAALIAVPKIIEFRVALALLATQSPNLTAALSSTARFLTGPWGIAIAAAMLGAKLLADYIDSLQASTEDVEASFKGAKTAADVFMTVSQGKDAKFWMQWSTEVQDQLSDLPAVLEAAAEQSDNLFSRFDSTHFGAFEALKQAGETLGTLAKDDLPGAQEGFRLLAAETDGSDKQLWRLISTMPAYRDALETQALALGLINSETSEAERKTAILELAQGTGAKQSESAARAYVDAADGAETLRKDLDQLIEVMNKANGIGQDAVSANIDYQQTLSDVQKQIEEVRKGTEGYGVGLSLNTQAGRDNQAMLVEQAQAAQDAAKAQLDLDGNADAYYASLVDGRQKMIDNALALGATREEAEKLADTIFSIPSEAEVKVIADTTEAQRRLDAIKSTLAAFQGSKSTITAYVRQMDQANGGVVDYFAQGGFSGPREHHVAQIAAAGTMRVWAEPETGGEAYIPLAPSKRERSLAIWEETGHRLDAFADGGFSAGTSKSKGGVTIIVQPSPGMNEDDLAEKIARILRGE